MNRNTALAGGLVATGALVLLIKKAQAQPPPPPPPGLASLYGKLTDTSTGKGIAGALINLNGLITTTDSGGQYAFAELEPGGYALQASREGYHSGEVNISLLEGENELNIELTPVTMADFSVPSQMVTDITNGSIWEMYWLCKVWCTITNNGDTPGSHNVHVWDNVDALNRTFQVTLQPGETYTWQHSQYIDFRRVSSYEVYLQGDWVNNNTSKAIFP